MNFIDLSGRRFGNLVVVERAKARKQVYWICKCDCGNKKQVFGGSLTSKRTLSCGCIRMLNGQFVRKRPYESLYNLLIRGAKKELSHSLTYDEFVEFTHTLTCHYCGEGVSWTAYNLGWNGGRYNLDRKDNAVGYTKDNCVVCCKRCNRAKSDSFTYEEWLQIGRCMQANPDLFRKNQCT